MIGNTYEKPDEFSKRVEMEAYLEDYLKIAHSRIKIAKKEIKKQADYFFKRDIEFWSSADSLARYVSETVKYTIFSQSEFFDFVNEIIKEHPSKKQEYIDSISESIELFKKHERKKRLKSSKLFLKQYEKEQRFLKNMGSK